MAQDLKTLLMLVVRKKASDLFITAGVPPSIKVDGKIMATAKEPLAPDEARQMVMDTVPEYLRDEFQRTHECNFALSESGLGRFRVSAFYQRNHVGMVLRRIETQIPNFEGLNLPPVLEKLAMTKRGLVLFVGATGTGKSTSLAAMLGYRNHHGNGHIVTLEDPIEFIHQHDGCIVTQREVGLDTDSYEVGLRNTLRQAPDVILIGEIRSRETMDYAIAFAETGHLCLSTLHANNANQALDRIINFFPEDRRDQLLMDLSLNLKAMIAQQLIPTVDGKARRAAVEVLINSPLASEYIRNGEIHRLKDLMKRSREQGMQTFDQALFDLYKAGEISYDNALHYADSPNEVRLMIKLDEEDVDKLGDAIADMEIDNSDQYSISNQKRGGKKRS
ncbi:PilT/PilU family type 4a pilus ATPase [Thiohalobacter thiocyanaticus]|uniref:PilT/PilU family type 4a pilus ATPase n=1 Tax=Thiohalobacter thiocyanaticus TaxID=585455 RepID=A0A426QKG6_9GAMM|nr:PilT/PilU family type 4a pilus ATPase [Thiohalobacter thiocyanaticus]RRQ22187.1 PilT/PilU family type 4a pilus ATPase [Thiohalobacter thiocyanaticus]